MAKNQLVSAKPFEGHSTCSGSNFEEAQVQPFSELKKVGLGPHIGQAEIGTVNAEVRMVHDSELFHARRQSALALGTSNFGNRRGTRTLALPKSSIFNVPLPGRKLTWRNFWSV